MGGGFSSASILSFALNGFVYHDVANTMVGCFDPLEVITESSRLST